MSAAAKDEWPSHTEELTRKVSDVLNDVVWRVEHGTLTAGDAYVILGFVYDTVAGLIDRDLMDLTLQVRAAFKKETKR